MTVTYRSLAHQRVARLWRAVYGADVTDAARARVDVMLDGWGDALVPQRPRWPSDIGDDHSPFELSVATDGAQRSLRFLVEAQGAEPTLAATRRAALDATARLGALGVNLARFESIRDVFLPDVTHARFALWHAVQLTGGLDVKAYFNPQILGKARSYPLVEEALARLGFASSWPAVLAASQRRGADDEIRYFGLELSAERRARVKVYFYQRGVGVEHLERMASIQPGYVPGEVTEICRALTGSDGPYVEHPVCTYLSLVEGEEAPTEVTIRIPIRFYAAHDGQARDRVIAYLTRRGLSSATYEAALEAMTTRPLSAGSGLTSYVSLRPGTQRFVYYLSFEAFGAPAPRGRDVARPLEAEG